MNTYHIIVACTFFIFLPLTVFIGKIMYKRAIGNNWKNPEQYLSFGQILMIIPAQSVTRLISKATPDTFFLHGVDDYHSFGGFVAMLAVFLIVYVIMIIPAKLLAKKYPIARIEPSIKK